MLQLALHSRSIGRDKLKHVPRREIVAPPKETKVIRDPWKSTLREVLRRITGFGEHPRNELSWRNAA